MEDRGAMYIVGTGPGNPEYITLRSLKIIRSSDVVAGWESILSGFREYLDEKIVVELSFRSLEEGAYEAC